MGRRDEYETVARRYSVSYMSDAKWIRLFTSVARSPVTIEYAKWSTIGSDHTFLEAFPEESNLHATRFGDGRFQLLEYKWILAIAVPGEYRPIPDVGFTRRQDIGGLRSAIEAAGQFQLDETENCLTILGYAL